jgi:hypothetical protein
MALYHQVRRLRLFLRQTLDGHAYWQSAIHVVKKVVRRQMIPWGEGVLGTAVAESTCSAKRQPPHPKHGEGGVLVDCISPADTRWPHATSTMA